jgi:hypothetical protein
MDPRQKIHGPTPSLAFQRRTPAYRARRTGRSRPRSGSPSPRSPSRRAARWRPQRRRTSAHTAARSHAHGSSRGASCPAAFLQPVDEVSRWPMWTSALSPSHAGVAEPANVRSLRSQAPHYRVPRHRVWPHSGATRRARRCLGRAQPRTPRPRNRYSRTGPGLCRASQLARNPAYLSRVPKPGRSRYSTPVRWMRSAG